MIGHHTDQYKPPQAVPEAERGCRVHGKKETETGTENGNILAV